MALVTARRLPLLVDVQLAAARAIFHCSGSWNIPDQHKRVAVFPAAAQTCVYHYSNSSVGEQASAVSSQPSASPSISVSSPQSPPVPFAASHASASAAASQPTLDFHDVRSIFSHRSTADLLRAYLVLKACSVNALVRNAGSLVNTSRSILGDRITFAVIRHTFFKQFCAGEDEQSMVPTMDMLRANGIRAIIDYAAEDDVEPGNDSSKQQQSATPPSGNEAGDGKPSSTASTTEGAGATSAFRSTYGVVGRTYSYENELTCDKHVGVFLRAIDAAAQLPQPGFAAIKVTALGNPQLLERMSTALLEIRGLFQEGDSNGDGHVDSDEFGRLYMKLFPHSSADTVNRAFQTLDIEGQGRVDIITWVNRIHLQDMPAMVDRVKRHGTQNELSDDLVRSALTDEEVGLADAMLGRVRRLADSAAQKAVKLMIDAEHTYFQPAIDHTVKQLSLEYNGTTPIIFNTYQCYLKQSHVLLLEDMERARREGYVFAAKLVRGAYLELERKRAAEQGYPSPVWDTIQETHVNYDRSVVAVLADVKTHKAEVMVASHNEDSIELTVRAMAKHGLPPSGSGVYFGQLLGMADNLTFTLGQKGYEAFKYVPYGPIQLVLPYLIRRAQENSAIMGAGVAKQMSLLRTELHRRWREQGIRGLWEHRVATDTASSSSSSSYTRSHHVQA
eukprot:jgi/Chrzof1/10797/Cz05g12130.t1